MYNSYDIYTKIDYDIFYKYYNIMNANITFSRKPFRLEPLKKKHYKKAVDIKDISENKETINKNEIPKKPYRLAPLNV